MPRYRYTQLKEGRTPHPAGVRTLFRDLAEYFLRTGNVELALNRLLLTGASSPDGEQLLPGMSDLLAQARKARETHLLRYTKEPLLGQLRERLRLLAGGGSTLGLDGVSGWESRLRTGPRGEIEGEEGVAALARCLMRLGLTLRHPGPLVPKMTDLCREEVRKAQERASLDPSSCRAIEAVLAACVETYALQAFLERNNFVGEEPLSHERATELMEVFCRLDELERSMRALSWGQPLEQIDAGALHSLLGQEAAVVLRRLASIRELLEEAGLLTCRAGELRLTAQGISRIGQQVLEEIFSALGKRRFASKTSLQGEVGTERTEETRPFQEGDPFAIAVGKSLLNAVRRQGAQGGLRIRLEDLEVFQPDQTSDTATALLLDMSWSMAEKDRFYGAKKVALALHTLMRRRFPRDALHIVGFYDRARRIAMSDLPYARPYEGVPGTNMQEAFRLSADLLRHERASNKQIILISDGEPNAYTRSGQVFFQQPPSRDAVEQTLREVERCTRTEIVINTFMLNDAPEAASFVERLTRINRGRAFYADPDNLGEYLLVNYLEGTRRRVESAGRKGSLRLREGLEHEQEHVAH